MALISIHKVKSIDFDVFTTRNINFVLENFSDFVEKQYLRQKLI